ncbi:hypothetical protein D3C72_1835410 [compost metagenome]
MLPVIGNQHAAQVAAGRAAADEDAFWVDAVLAGVVVKPGYCATNLADDFCQRGFWLQGVFQRGDRYAMLGEICRHRTGFFLTLGVPITAVNKHQQR